MASQSDRKGAFAEVLQAMTFERRARRLRRPEPPNPPNTERPADVRLGAHQAGLSIGLALVTISEHSTTADACVPAMAGALPLPELTRTADVKLN